MVQFSIPSPRSAGLRAASLSLAIAVAASPLTAQVSVTPVSNNERAVPQLRIFGVNNVMSLAQWPGVSMKVDEESHVVMFAVTRGRADIPIQVLSPRRPGLETRIRGGRTIQARALDRRELLHLVNYGEAPLVVAFASRSKPDLEQFRFGPEWADDMLLDTLVTSQEEMLQVLGKTVFGQEAEFSVAVATAPNPTPLSRFAESWYFDNGCTGQSSYYWRRSALGWFGGSMFDDINPSVRNAFGLSLYGRSPFAFGMAFGMGFGVGMPAMFYGSMVSLVAPITLGGQFCTGYRVAWWPSVLPPINRPVPVDTTGLPTDSSRTGIPAVPASRAADEELIARGPAIPVPSPAFEPSAWRRGETGSERRFPAVVAEERPWNTTRALPSRATGSEYVGDAGNLEARQRAGERRYQQTEWNRNRGVSNSGGAQASGNASNGNAASRAPSPTRGREFPTSGSGTPASAGGAQTEAPRPAPAPRSDGAIIPPTPAGQPGGTP
ncbi:hypothetical protein GAU_2151 [Gemmatimonas aurantiaca T-27]|uniref:Uncharacterized protein n=1 Tax=Gemmatimonas aurantiaca (strain DSM 14586 / JCM 11422 / NBRC 100505 / T-27) TaxID=379066 RepID=C1A9L6_GEMAT|nr:hypothetical protein [Gemmatimonas aurantiaca]BAH39193.1 hypothetical protein GAU_2151 [Gemmatimonas aurantiaca T-27]